LAVTVSTKAMHASVPYAGIQSAFC